MKTCHSHPNFEIFPGTTWEIILWQHDIALIEVHQNLTKWFAPMEMNLSKDELVPFGSNVTIIGFGSIGEENPNTPMIAQSMTGIVKKPSNLLNYNWLWSLIMPFDLYLVHNEQQAICNVSQCSQT